MSSVEALTERVKQLEEELNECRRRLACGDDAQMKCKSARPKINVLSPEVVDSNPYRFLASWLVFTFRGAVIKLLFRVRVSVGVKLRVMVRVMVWLRLGLSLG